MLISTTLLCACSNKPKGKSPISVQTGTIQNATFNPSLSAISALESTTNVALRPEADGRVVKILAKEGEQVYAGQPIIVLDNTQQSAKLNAAKAEAQKDLVNAERYNFLYNQGAASAKTRDLYETLAIESRDRAIASKATLDYKFVRSPIDGVVGDLDTVKLGDYVKTGQPLTGIVDNSTLWTLMQIPASQANRVQLGQTVMIASQSTPVIKGQGTVTFISPYFAMPDTKQSPNTLMVKATFPNLTGQLKTGQFVKSNIITGQNTSLAVPVQSVFMQAEQPFVYLVIPLSSALTKIKASPNTPKQTIEKLKKLPQNTPIVIQHAVKLGNLQGNYYPVQSGLRMGDKVVVGNTALLSNGMPVKTTTTSNQGSNQ